MVRKNLDDYQRRMERLQNCIGIAVSKWAALEAYLPVALTVALGRNAVLTSQILASVKTFSLALDITHAAMRDALKDRAGELSFWNSLVEYLRELSGDRNFIAHTPILSGSPTRDGSGEEDWAAATITVGPSMSAFMADEQFKRMMTEDDLHESIRDFDQAHELLGGFLAFLVKPGPSPEKYQSPVSRRRPPRKQRLAVGQK